RRQSGDERGAAEAIEAMAQNQLVAEHRLEDWHAAAVIWLDRVNDVVRGRAALERASEIDLAYGDVFDRLVALARDGKEHAILAGPYPDDKKAEETYRKILEHREDDDIFKRLVDVYVRLGDGEQAVETHKERVRLATDPVVRRARLIELARLLDEVAGDPERA